MDPSTRPTITVPVEDQASSLATETSSKAWVQIWTFTALCILVGCGGEIRQTLPSLATPMDTPGKDELTVNATSASRSDPLELELPFPERVNPFAVAHRREREGTDTTPASSVEVLGFAKVGRQQVMLRVADEVHFLVEGDIIGGVEVLQIRPPRVRLRNGNLTWEASMFEGGADKLKP